MVSEQGFVYLRSVSSVASKLFCLFSSAVKASLAIRSSGVGSIVDIGGVTPYCLDVGAAMMAIQEPPTACAASVIAQDIQTVMQPARRM